MNLVDPAIADFYTHSNEDTRLQIGLGPLEFERNKILILQHLSRSQFQIADIGGGTGHYSSWLAGLGHKVTLIDPVPKHIEKAKRKTGSFKALLGEARKLPLENSSIDIAILHGPLYHLQKQSDRMLALKEARRILRPGGMVLGFAITHAASVLAALHNGMIHHPSIFEMCRTELLSGEHHAPPDITGLLSNAYYHRPAELVSEFEAAGFQVNGLQAVEGMVWMDAQFFQSWYDTRRRELLLELIKMTDRDTSLLCLSPHMMISASFEI